MTQRGGKNMSIFTGSAVAIITPFNNDGSVNYEAFKNMEIGRASCRERV